jgi:hypothetical protein
MDSAFTNHQSGGEDAMKIGTEVLHHRRGSGPYNGKVTTCADWDGNSRNYAHWQRIKTSYGPDFHGAELLRILPNLEIAQENRKNSLFGNINSLYYPIN